MAVHAYEPNYAVAPGETLQETIEALGFDQVELADRTGLTTKHINRIISGEATLSADTAILLDHVTGVPASMWNQLESRYREMLKRQKQQEGLKADLNWLKNIPVRALMHRGYVDSSPDQVVVLESVLRFFGVASIGAWQEGWSRHHFSFRKFSQGHVNGAMASWLRMGELEANKLVCQHYDKTKFSKALHEIRGMTTELPEIFVPKMIQACARAGVALVLVPEIKGAAVSGAAKWISPVKAMICLNLFGKSNDRFWFGFFHEAGHILHDSKKEAFLDVDYRDDPSEKEANAFAATMLIPARHDAELPALKSLEAVRGFAEKMRIHPGIVVGRLQKEKLIAYSRWNLLKDKLIWSSPSAR